MSTLTLDEKTAKKLYPSAVPEFKAMMEHTFGKQTFSQKITDRVKTFEDACEINGINPEHARFTTGTVYSIAHERLVEIIKALREGWTPDWNNKNQAKWSPWFWMDSPGFRFDDSYYYCAAATSNGGSRLVLQSKELSDYVANQFLNEYKNMLV